MSKRSVHLAGRCSCSQAIVTCISRVHQSNRQPPLLVDRRPCISQRPADTMNPNDDCRTASQRLHKLVDEVNWDGSCKPKTNEAYRNCLSPQQPSSSILEGTTLNWSILRADAETRSVVPNTPMQVLRAQCPHCVANHYRTQVKREQRAQNCSYRERDLLRELLSQKLYLLRQESATTTVSQTDSRRLRLSIIQSATQQFPRIQTP